MEYKIFKLGGKRYLLYDIKGIAAGSERSLALSK
jgi:hypothetical protein